jgi:hypothetical protein
MLPFFPTPLPMLVDEAGWQVRKESETADGVVVAIERRES